MKNTEQQELAITTIDENIAVNAGAGTGKTKVLTERYVYILENGRLEKNKEVESIVAITFTKKATQEMKERIREEIKNRFPLGNQWRRYYKDMEKANISTIHSFCSNILRDNALEANVDPIFNVLDGDEGDLLLEEIILKLVFKGIEEDENIYNMVKVFNKGDLTNVVEEVKSIYYEIRNTGYSFGEVKKVTLDTIDSIEVNLEKIQHIKDKFIYLMDNSRKNSKVYKLKDDQIWIDFYNDSYDKDDLIPILEHLYDNIGTNAKEKETIEELKSKINRIFLIKEKEYRWLYKTLLDLLVQVDEQYSKVKDEQGVLDYDDLQILVLKLLDNKAIRKRYQKKFKYIMVDEFQDTNELQKKIFYKLCTKDEILDRSNLFIVGDPKQSIYGFRGADLEVFYDVMEDIERVSGKETITLDKNFRTVDTILDFINGLFQKLMTNKYTRLTNYHESQNKIDVEILEKKDLEVPDNINASDYHRHYESRLIASRIKELVDDETFEYGDFVLLFRSTTSVHIYEEALREYDIPYYNISGRGFYQSQEIIDIINGLKAISNRYDTISTIGFLRSPMIGLSDRTIYWLVRYKENNILETMDKDIPHIEEREKNNILKAKGILHELIIKKDLYGVNDLLRRLIDRTYYLETLLLHRGGRQSVANVYKLLEIAKDFDKSIAGSLEDFIDYMDTLEDRDESQAKIESEDANVVKIMTIHKSKGLQFPVVIIPQMSRRFNHQQPYALFNKEKGIGLKYDNAAILYERMKEEVAQKEDEENKRILYVAMTRAKERLIVGNQGRNIGFKKMIKDLIDVNQISIIEDIKGYENLNKPVKVIHEDLLKSKTCNHEAFPLVGKISSYDQRTFSSFSISQYMEFSQCRRRFFMGYYKRLPFENIRKEETIERDLNDIKRLSPTTRGNIVHGFCEYYRKGMEPRSLMKKIVSSFGMEYSLEIEEELNPYIENYLKHYREDYTSFYIEKSFYLKVGDNYINGIIDRINIKDGKAEIIDFKTNRVYNKKNLLRIYEPQLQLYSYAFQKISNMEVKSASILFLETGELEEVDISKRALKENYENIKRFIQFVTTHNSIEQYEKSTNCESNCKYNILCNLE